jgi:hypothetical protein
VRYSETSGGSSEWKAGEWAGAVVVIVESIPKFA